MASARATRHVEKRLEKSPSLARWEVAETDEVRILGHASPGKGLWDAADGFIPDVHEGGDDQRRN